MEMNKLKALSMLPKVNAALNENDYGQLALALGITPAMIEEMSIQDLMEAMTVRMADLNRALEKGLKNE
jgi:hypothetical protein